jgi:LysR family transcriptional regulator of gallate degradation
MLRGSDALSFTTSRTVDLEEGAGLVMLKVPQLTVRREAGVVLRRGGFVSPAAQRVIDHLADICRADPRN